MSRGPAKGAGHGGPAKGPGKGSPRAEPFTEGNTAALSHGAHSDRVIAPVRAERLAALERRYPHIDPSRRVLQAQRLAQIEVGAAWLEERGNVVRDDEGRVYDIADRISKWSAAAERWFEHAEEERRERTRYADLDEFMDPEQEDDVEDDE